MLKGFNTDINVKGTPYHVQTEDWGAEKATLVCRIYKSGAVVKTIKTSYQEALQGGPVNNQEALKHALRKLHSQVLDSLSSGSLL